MPPTQLQALGITADPRFVSAPQPGDTPESGVIVSRNPATGEVLGGVKLDTPSTYESTLAASVETFRKWRDVPAPVRGQVVRAIGEEFRANQVALGELIAMEMGKIRAEGIGEVQETIDIADYAVGLSRQLPGLTIPSERPGHRLFEQWLPLGPIGVISAFNFPNAVWAWNAMLAAVCGDVTIWKPSLLTPLTSLATHRLAAGVAESMGHPGIFRLLLGTDDIVGERLIADRRVPLISATGSCRMGRRVGQVVASRLGRSLLELGGNNAVIVHQDADLDLALRGILFAAVGTCGQRCTSTRRLIVHEKIADAFIARMVTAYKSIRLGDPMDEHTLVGPLVNEQAVEGYLRAIETAKSQGGAVLTGGARASVTSSSGKPLTGNFVEPTIIRAPRGSPLPIAREETFAPILYVFTYTELDEALAMHNSVDQGLSSAIFTEGIRSSEKFLSASGSDCGLAYVNLGTSGAEIGGAFGGEKDTGGGRESGSDSWKAYMRRQTCTVNFGGKFELAQGIRFE
ncbi:MAG: aldehyde dehydrogenase family protein [Pyrinomonadaceae bacterium]|nr:aldehyde dehydrogenase family protein [Phycisphaerales bacterium]